jgi:hypothetical protein
MPKRQAQTVLRNSEDPLRSGMGRSFELVPHTNFG